MTWKDQSVLAVIPARGGSKGIPRKNLCEVGGRSLIAWAGQTCRELSWLDAAILSTDDEEMAEEGRRAGLDVPFIRPADFATDQADAVGMWRHAWLESEKHFGRRFDLSILLQPTTPLRNSKDCERCVEALVEGDHRAATTVSPLPGHCVPEKMLKLDAQGRVEFAFPGAKTSRRQDAGDYFMRNGICYAVRRETLVDDGLIVEDDCIGVLVDGFIVNIDEPIELELAQFMYERMKRES